MNTYFILCIECWMFLKKDIQIVKVLNIRLTIKPPILSRDPVALLLFSVYCFVDRCFSFSSFSFGDPIVFIFLRFTASEFWLPLWYLQTSIFIKNNDSQKSDFVLNLRHRPSKHKIIFVVLNMCCYVLQLGAHKWIADSLKLCHNTTVYHMF